MGTTIDIPEELFKEAQSILGFKSKTDVVIFSLQEVIRSLVSSSSWLEDFNVWESSATS